jgi:hypothetical protein
MDPESSLTGDFDFMITEPRFGGGKNVEVLAGSAAGTLGGE